MANNLYTQMTLPLFISLGMQYEVCVQIKTKGFEFTQKQYLVS